MKSIQPDGAVRLAGYSFGACVAMEMALQLQQQAGGGGVESLVLIDGTHSYVAAYVDYAKQQLEVPKDTASVETAVICSFLSKFAYSFAHSAEVCYNLP